MQSPTAIAHYLIQRELGRGAMGVVYLAEDTRLGRPVAIKSLPADLAEDQFRRTRFEQEARSLAAINHPNIGAIYGIEQEGDSLYLILELAEGLTLSDRISLGALELNEALDICRQVALGIGAAHARNIIHRDLKPDNIKIRPDGVVKVLDFGIALAGEVMPVQAQSVTMATIVQPPSTHIKTGFIMGTPGYMSPEQARGKPVGAGTDVWAIGCILYECLTSRPAFPGETLADAIAITLLGEPNLAALPSKTPSRILTLVKRCLEKDWQRRTLSMAQIVAELEAALDELRRGGGVRVGQSGLNDRWPPGPGTVPASTPRLLGRDRLIGACAGAFEDSRLLTLGGPSGSGRTSLVVGVANAVRESRGAGAWMITLPASSDPELLGVACVHAFGLPASGVPAELLAGLIGNRDPLLVIDGCEHSPRAASAFVQSLLDACPNARVLATSRSPLGISGGATVAVGPIGDDPRSPSRECIELFLQAARRSRADYEPEAGSLESITDLCRLVGGWPLAVQILGSMAASMSPAEIRAQLEQRRLVSGASVGDVMPADMAHALVIGWVFDQRQPAELALILQASAFVLPPTLRMVVGASGARDCLPSPESDELQGGPVTVRETRAMNLLPRLAGAGLVSYEGAGEDIPGTRLFIPMPVRLAAAQRLRETPAAEAAVRAGHASYCLASLEQARSRWSGPGSGGWVARMRREYAEHCHALRHAAPEVAARITGVLDEFRAMEGGPSPRT